MHLLHSTSGICCACTPAELLWIRIVLVLAQSKLQQKSIIHLICHCFCTTCSKQVNSSCNNWKSTVHYNWIYLTFMSRPMGINSRVYILFNSKVLLSCRILNKKWSCRYIKVRLCWMEQYFEIFGNTFLSRAIWDISVIINGNFLFTSFKLLFLSFMS